MVSKHILYITFLNKLEFFFTKWFQVFLYKSHTLTSVICLHTICSIWSTDRIYSGATTPGQRRPGNSVSGGVLHIPQISKTGASSSDGLMYLKQTFEKG